MKQRIFPLSKVVQRVLLLFLTSLSLLLSSCVNEDTYELYDDDLDGDIVVRNKKSKDDINFGSNITENYRVFNNTCFMVASCHASSRYDNLDSYISKLDDFIRNKRSADLYVPIDNNNRERIVQSIFGTSSYDARNGATYEEMIGLLSSLTERDYGFYSCTTAEQVTQFIYQHQQDSVTHRKFWSDKHFYDYQYVVSINVNSTQGHVFNYDSGAGDLGATMYIWNFEVSGPSGSYAGVYYPLGLP